jgi:predicted DNA-binding transcriptional regulator AlpA
MTQSVSRQLPQTGFVRLPAILFHIPVGKSTWWEGVRTGRFPSPVKLGPKITAWRAEDIHELIKQLAASSAPVVSHEG